MVLKSVPGAPVVVGNGGISLGTDAGREGYFATVCVPTSPPAEYPEGVVDIHVTREQLENLVATGRSLLGYQE